MTARIEWPTVLVAVTIYGGFGLLTWRHTALIWPLVLLPGAYLVAWQGSLQHEVVHGHPTPWPWLNELMVLPSLWLWLPFRVYRTAHLAHHTDDQLTDPRCDPESFYLTRDAWQRRGRVARGLTETLNTTLGRLILGPPMVVFRLAADTFKALRLGRVPVRAWLLHGLGVLLVLGWVIAVCEIPLTEYLLLYVWPGISLTLMRSFAEHEARPAASERTLAVETHPLLALLYLNNNLHPAHHSQPGRAWYRLPAAWADQRAQSRVIVGYGSLLAQHLLTPRIDAIWPLERRDGPNPNEPPDQRHLHATRGR